MRFSEIESGPLTIFRPPEPGKHYIIASDVAQNVQDGDFTTAEVFEYHESEQVAEWRGRIYPDEWAEKLFALGALYNWAFIAVEANPGGGGLTTLNILFDKLGYPNLYLRQRVDRTDTKISYHHLGWLTTGKTKPVMYNELAEALRNGWIVLHSEALIREAFKVQYDPQKRGQEAFGALPPAHDDLVDALAIYWQARKQFSPAQAVKPDVHGMLVDAGVVPEKKPFDPWELLEEDAEDLMTKWIHS